VSKHLGEVAAILLKHLERERMPRVVSVQKLFGFPSAQAQQFNDAAERDLLGQVALEDDGFEDPTRKLGSLSQLLGDFVWQLHGHLHGVVSKRRFIAAINATIAHRNRSRQDSLAVRALAYADAYPEEIAASLRLHTHRDFEGLKAVSPNLQKLCREGWL
jgi:hypothetical protein